MRSWRGPQVRPTDAPRSAHLTAPPSRCPSEERAHADARAGGGRATAVSRRLRVRSSPDCVAPPPLLAEPQLPTGAESKTRQPRRGRPRRKQPDAVARLRACTLCVRVSATTDAGYCHALFCTSTRRQHCPSQPRPIAPAILVMSWTKLATTSLGRQDAQRMTSLLVRSASRMAWVESRTR